MPPLVYLVRRGVKAAIEADADLLLLDMETNGGRVDVTEEIIEILGQFPGKTARPSRPGPSSPFQQPKSLWPRRA